jgi:hypothetical protein
VADYRSPVWLDSYPLEMDGGKSLGELRVRAEPPGQPVTGFVAASVLEDDTVPLRHAPAAGTEACRPGAR